MAKKDKNNIWVPWDGGPAYLRKREGYWHMDVTPRGETRIRQKTGKADVHEAKIELDRLLGKLTRKEPVEITANYTIKRLFEDYIASQVADKKWDAKVAEGFKDYSSRLFSRWEKLQPRHLTTEMIQAYRTERLSTPVKSGTNRKETTKPKHSETRLVQPATVDREISFLRMAFRWKHKLSPHVLPTLPDFAGRIAGIKAVNKRQGFITWQQFVEDFLPQLPFHQRALAVCAMVWGGRKGEWLSLDWTDINFNSMVIHFDETKSNHPREVRIVPGVMEDELRKLKTHHEITCPKQIAVFTYRGERISEIKNGWGKAAKRAGLHNLLFHDTRRSAGVILRDAGLSTEEIMEAMGHETDSMFYWYGIKSKNFLDSTGSKVTTHLEGLGKAS